MGLIQRGADGFFHPEREDEIVDLIVWAKTIKKQIRVRGSGHSVVQAIYTDGYEGSGEPPGGNVDIMLDKYRAIGQVTPIEGDPDHATVTVEGGCNLGKNPYDPTKTSTWRNSLNYTLQKSGWALDDLGGITHQTVSGFLSTGSSGGSLCYSIDDDLIGIRIIDGTGTIHDLSRDDPDPAKRDMFFAAGVSMGLLGIISKVTFKVRKSFNLFGAQVTNATDKCGIDFFGDGTKEKPSLEKFLRDTPYTRLMWWPQKGFTRMQVWQAARMAPMPNFEPKPYQELGDSPEIASLAGSLFYTLIGNLDDVSVVPSKLGAWYQHLEGAIDGSDDDVNACCAPKPRAKIDKGEVLAFLKGRLAHAMKSAPPAKDSEHTQSILKSIDIKIEGAFSDVLASIVTKLIELLLDGALSSHLAQILASFLKKEMPNLIDTILGLFVTDGTDDFWDSWMCGLPMDNQMDDQLWPTQFTELWVPVEKTKDVMLALKAYYDGGGDPKTAYDHTGAFSCELYAAKKSPFWMSPSYGTDVFRVDVFWFALNAGAPTDSFYPPFWEILKPFAFRPHWGKFLPAASAEWRAHYRACFPKFDDFLALRAKLDPDQVFVSDYWRRHFGIEKAGS